MVLQKVDVQTKCLSPTKNRCAVSCRLSLIFNITNFQRAIEPDQTQLFLFQKVSNSYRLSGFNPLDCGPDFSNSSPPGVFHLHLIKFLYFDRGQKSKILSINHYGPYIDFQLTAIAPYYNFESSLHLIENTHYSFDIT